MEKSEGTTHRSKASEYTNIIEGLLDLSSSNFELSQLEKILVDKLFCGKTVNMEFITFLASIARSGASIRDKKIGPITKDNPTRIKIVKELSLQLEWFCTKFGLNKELALIGVRLRQGDFFIIEDKQKYLTPLLPTAAVRNLAMALCGMCTLPIEFKRKFGEYPDIFSLDLSFESAIENFCKIGNINPLVPRLAALDEEALKCVESTFKFSRKAFTWFIVTLTNLPLFVLEGIALRELKKLIYLKELECEMKLKTPEGAEEIKTDYYDNIDFETQLYENPKEYLEKVTSLSYLNELFEVLLFNTENYTSMDYGYITAGNRRLGSFAVDDKRATELLGDCEQYYKDIAATFYHSPKSEEIWLSKKQLRLDLSWLKVDDRKKKKNVWEEIKRLLQRMSLDPNVTNNARHKYSKITLGQLVFFTTLFRMRKRINTRYEDKLSEEQYMIYCVELEMIGLLYESVIMMNGALTKEYSRIRVIKVLSLALNAFIPNIWDHIMIQSIYESPIYFPMKPKFDSPEEIKSALDYCRAFVEKVCMETTLKNMNYLSFSEFNNFLIKPSDGADAASVALHISPYVKRIEVSPPLKDKELYPAGRAANDIFASIIDDNIYLTRSLSLAKPRELYAKAIEGKSVDPICLMAHYEVSEFMGSLEKTFVLELEKMDLILDLGADSLVAYNNTHEVLKKASLITDERGATFCKSIIGIIAKKDRLSFSESLNSIISLLVPKRDGLGIRNLLLLVHKMEKPEDLKVLANLSPEVIQAVKSSKYPMDAINPKYLERAELKEVSKAVVANAYFGKVAYSSDETLNLSNQRLNDEDAEAIAEGLKRNSYITDVDLHNNEIGEKGIIALAQILGPSSLVRSLNLAWENKAGNKGMYALAQQLRANTCLITLRLNHNSIGDPGAFSISDFLKTNQVLQVLDLYSNLITDEGALSIAEALGINKTLLSLSMHQNLYGEKAITQFLLIMEQNTIIQRLFLARMPAIKSAESRITWF